jgi:hypothetical protein
MLFTQEDTMRERGPVVSLTTRELFDTLSGRYVPTCSHCGSTERRTTESTYFNEREITTYCAGCDRQMGPPAWVIE